MHLGPRRRHRGAARSLVRRLSVLPPTATPAAMAAQVQVQFFAGAVLAVVLSALPGQEGALVGALLASAAFAVGLALVVRWRGGLRAWALHTILVLGSLIVTVAAMVASDSDTSIAFAFCYSIMVVVAIASASWRGVALHVALALTGLFLQHSWGGVGSPTTIVIMAFILVLLAVFTGRIVHATVAAEIDVLTRLPNRRGFERAVTRALGRSAATVPSADGARQLSVVVVDLDHFEVINRTRGQAVGDDVLRSAARALRDLAPGGAAVARLDGDLFAMVLPDHSAAAVLDLAHRVQQALSPVEASLGVAHVEPDEDGGALLRRAESALHSAKGGGRNCIRLAAPEDARLLRALRTAVATSSIQVALQPLVDPTSERTVGVEALARWLDDVHGWVSPGVFIPLAEKNGLVPDLGAAVLERACRDAGVLVAHLGRPLMLTVNASGGELVREEYVQQVAEVLQRTGWPAHDLVIEVTESSLEAASTATMATVRRLQEVGVRIAIDDFGTGYSAFSQLDAIPAEYLKLDTSFTAATTTSPRRRAMLSALVGLCRDLGIKVIAEGVETPEHAALVAEHGCDLAQGFYFAKPQSVGDLIASLDRVPHRTTQQGLTGSGSPAGVALP
ncbi:putative bifunctional diguanylate cyclase/phosphodiesterase [Quadrisphaera setariae]|uniref:EAL domain-containing protein n=1 Tax=Quadrisphaera setariae TaxID=2593304 RepID=A0A5C8ZG74_9ACTN|nr:GGDEF domain-containing phosphodiesterase [Quadrisphaera setariae]TXR57055.1 EAL domain-containing protein [Quadrisphaera setariae]